MALSSGVKFRCYPTIEQEKILSAWIDSQRFIYNAKVGEYRYFKTFGNKSLLLTGRQIPVDQQYSQFKDRELTPFLYHVPSQVLRNGATRFMKAYISYASGLSNQPAFKKNRGRQSVWVTSELFRFVRADKEKSRGKRSQDHDLMLGTKKVPFGKLRFKAHAEYGIPASITISRNSGKWYVSFSYDKVGADMSGESLINLYGGMTQHELEPISIGIDRGVEVPAMDSMGEKYGFKEIEICRMARKERRKKKYQRMMARRIKGSGRWKRALREASKGAEYRANVRENFAHQTSRKIVDGTSEVIFFEGLNIKGMTARPKPQPDGKGAYLPNGASAKAGLNRAILDSAWGKVKAFTAYKAKRTNKLVLAVPPDGTSQECSHCGHTHPDNRQTQAKFECTICGFRENADVNAARVIKKRGITKLIAGEFTIKQKKKAMRLKKQESVGMERPEFIHGERHVRRDGGTTVIPQASMIRETPTTIAV